ncbi:MAG: hypothetical protein ABIK47_07800 [candidate division WOR-3 bacterium]
MAYRLEFQIVTGKTENFRPHPLYHPSTGYSGFHFPSNPGFLNHPFARYHPSPNALKREIRHIANPISQNPSPTESPCPATAKINRFDF